MSLKRAVSFNNGIVTCFTIFFIGALLTSVSGGSHLTCPELVSTESDTSEMYDPFASLGPDGTIHVVWGEQTDYGGSGSDYDIFYNSNPAGGSWSVTEVISTGSSLESRLAFISADSEGTAHVVWQDGDEILYRKKPAGGGWTDIEIVSDIMGTYSSACLDVDSVGTVHCGWMSSSDYGGSGNDVDIFYKKKPSGGSWTTTEVVSTESTGDCRLPFLDVDSTGTIHMAWWDETNYSGSGSDVDVFYKKKPSGGSWTATEVVSTESSGSMFFGNYYRSWLVVDSLETVHVAWNDNTNYNGAGTDLDVFYKKKPSGGSWTITEVVSTESIKNVNVTSLAIDSSGTVHIVWPDATDYGGAGDADSDIFYKEKPGGGTWLPAEVMTPESDDTSAIPVISADSHGVLHFIWIDQTDFGDSGGDEDIFYRQKFQADVLYVDDDNTLGPWRGTLEYPYQAIQDGIDAADDADTVMVADGTYTGTGNQNLNFHGKAITVRSENGPDQCVIEPAGDLYRGFYFVNGEGEDSVVMGFTIQNSHMSHGFEGAGIYCEGSSPTIVNNIIRNNSTAGYGGGIYCYNSDPLIKNNLITGNSGYRGGAIYCDTSRPTLINNTTVGNSASNGGGGIYLAEFSLSVDIIDSILWGNDAPSGAQIKREGTTSLSVTYCDVEGGYTGEGNIDADPQFVRGPLGGYYLSQIAAGQASTSPCVDTGSGVAQWPCISNPLGGTVCGTTRTDREPDVGILDMGYHYPDAGISFPPNDPLEWPPGDAAKFKRMD